MRVPVATGAPAIAHGCTALLHQRCSQIMGGSEPLNAGCWPRVVGYGLVLGGWALRPGTITTVGRATAACCTAAASTCSNFARICPGRVARPRAPRALQAPTRARKPARPRTTERTGPPRPEPFRTPGSRALRSGTPIPPSRAEVQSSGFHISSCAPVLPDCSTPSGLVRPPPRRLRREGTRAPRTPDQSLS